MKKASYRGIPCWYNPITDELKGRNMFYDMLVDIAVWLDSEVFETSEFPIWIETDGEAL